MIEGVEKGPVLAGYHRNENARPQCIERKERKGNKGNAMRADAD